MRRGNGRDSVSTDLAVWALPWVVRVLAVGVVVAAALGFEWLRWRVLGVAAFVGQALVILWLGFGGARIKETAVDVWSALWAVPWAVAGTVLVVTDLGTVGYDDDLYDREASVYDAIAHRVGARDVPPVAVYAAGMAASLLTVACLALALASWLHGRRGDDSPRPARTGRKAGAAGAVLVIVSLVAGVGLHTRADRSAESDSVTHAVTGAADRQDDAPGPAQPTAQAWRREMRYGTGAVVPGWDQVISLAGVRSGDVRAFSASDGDELWRYQREYVEPSTVTVDPDAGRVLLVVDDAAVVLDLTDGSEVAIRQLPELGGCGQVTDDPTQDTLERDGAVVIGTAAVMNCDNASDDEGDDRLVILDVSTARLLNSADIPSHMCWHATPTPSTPSPVILRWGWDSSCGDLTLLVPDTSDASDGSPGGFHEIPIHLPSLAGVSTGCTTGCDVLHVMARDDTIVLAVDPRTPSDDDHAAEIVAVDTAGELRWRTAIPAWTDDTWPGQRQPVLEAVTERGVVAVWDRQWRLLSSVDGRELARQPVADDNPVEARVVSTTDSERIYSYALASDGARLVVRRVDDLSLIGTAEVPPDAGDDLELLHAPGRLILDDDRGHLLGYEDGPPLDRPQ